MARGAEGRRGGEQAGASLKAEYQGGRKDWAAARRRAVWLSALWWGPGAVALGLFAGIGTKFPLFGLLVFALAVAAVIDVGFQQPRALVRIGDRAAAESSTARTLAMLRIRDGGHVFNDRIFSPAAVPFEVEHLVISPRGVFLIDSKQWNGFDVRLLGLDLYVNHVHQGDALKALLDQSQAIGEALGSAAGADEQVGVVQVSPVLAVHAAGLTGTPRVMGGVIVVRPEQLLDVLRSPDLRWSEPTTKNLATAAEYLLAPK